MRICPTSSSDFTSMGSFLRVESIQICNNYLLKMQAWGCGPRAEDLLVRRSLAGLFKFFSYSRQRSPWSSGGREWDCVGITTPPILKPRTQRSLEHGGLNEIAGFCWKMNAGVDFWRKQCINLNAWCVSTTITWISHRWQPVPWQEHMDVKWVKTYLLHIYLRDVKWG